MQTLVHPKNKVLSLLILLSCCAGLTACSKAEPVPVSACKKVVAHAKSILKDKAPSSSKMLAQCKAASDGARSCVMAADKPMKLLDCDF